MIFSHRLSILVILIAVYGLVAGGMSGIKSSQPGFGIDFFHFWAIPASRSDVAPEAWYDRNEHPRVWQAIDAEIEIQDSPRLIELAAENRELYAGGLHPTGTPFLYSLFRIFQTGRFDWDFWSFQIASILAFLAGMVLWGRAAGREPRFLIVAAIATPLLFLPWITDLNAGNTNRLQLGAIGLAGWLVTRSPGSRSHHITGMCSGIVWGLLILFKPNVVLAPAVLVGVLLLERRIREALGIGCGLAVGAGIGFLTSASVLGANLETWLAWRHYLSTIVAEPFSLEAGNVSWVALLPPAWQTPVALASAGVLCLGFVIAAQVGLSRTDRPAAIGRAGEAAVGGDSRLTAIAAGLLISLLISPVAWTHYFLFALPAILLLVPATLPPAAAQNAFRSLWPVGLGTVLVAGIPLAILPIRAPSSVCIMMMGGTALLLAALAAQGMRGSQCGGISSPVPPPGLGSTDE